MHGLLSQALGNLREARRHVRSQPDAAIGMVEIADHSLGYSYRVASEKDRCVLHRLQENLAIGCRIVHSCPDVLRSYLDGAIHELAEIMLQFEPRSEPGDVNAKPPRPAWRERGEKIDG